MIRMTIAGEDVVSNKEFTINEEMLATSSTILNNCYPKTWETNHDYVSNFYYPQDYSKCLIYDEKPILPKEYTQVDYIQSTGTQYIDLGIKGNENTKINAKYMASSFTNVMHTLGDISNTSKAISFNVGNSNSPVSRWGNYSTNQKTNNVTNTIYEVSISQNGYYINGNLWWLPNESIFTTANNMYLFTANGATNRLRGKIYYCKIWDSDTLVRNLIPCVRNSDNKVGMYDLVNNTFYTNKGTGNFTYGQLQETYNTKLLFSGVVKNSGDISLRPQDTKYCSLQILDFKTLLSEGETLDFVISNKTVLEAIQMVVDEISQYGFVLGNVNILGGNDVIGAYSTQNKTAYDVFQYLADITQSRWTTRMVDENTVAIDFYDPTLMPQGIDIDYTNQWFETYQVNDLSFSYGTRDYRNKQVMLSDQVYGGANYTDTIIADGYNNSFITTANIGLISSIYVNGTAATFGTNEDKEIGIDEDFYYTPGENTMSADSLYTAGTQIVVTYTPLIKGREVIYNTDEVQRINTQTGRKGVIARYEQRNDILTSDNLEKVGQAYIKYKGSAEIILTLTTMVDIYSVGEVVHFNAPITELDTDYMVKKKSTQIIATGDYSNIWYSYELTSSFNSETAINYFDNQRNKTTGNISEGEYITRNIDIENTANIIWDNLTIIEVTIDGDNVLNSPLNSPLVQ